MAPSAPLTWIRRSAALLAAVFACAPLARSQEKPFKPFTEEVKVRCPNCAYDEAKGRSADKPQPRAPVDFPAGSTCPVCTGSGLMATSVDWTGGFYYAQGFGVPPSDLLDRYRAAGAGDKEKVLGQARSRARRAAELDAWRNAVRLASRVRLDGERRVGDQTQKLTAEVVGMETLGGEWVTNAATPFFRIQVKVPLWGVKGVVATLLEESREAAKRMRATRKPFDWRGAAPGGEKPAEPPTPPAGGESKPPGGGEAPGAPPSPTTGAPLTPEAPATGAPPGEKPTAPPPTEPAPPTPPAPADSAGSVSSEKPASEVTGVIIDAREVSKEKGAVNPALFPKIEVAVGDGGQSGFQVVHDVADADPKAASEHGVISYVASDTPFERISAIFRARGWIVARLEPAESEPLAGPGPVLFPQAKRVPAGGAGEKKTYTFKLKAKDMEGAERVNVLVTAADAKAIRETDAATGVLKNCKIVVIAGGDIAGKRGALPSDTLTR